MNIKRKDGRRAPVAMMGRMNARRRRARERQGLLLESDPTSEPLSGAMLVLLSRLHRAERSPAEDDESAS